MDYFKTNWAEKMKNDYTANLILNNPTRYYLRDFSVQKLGSGKAHTLKDGKTKRFYPNFGNTKTKNMYAYTPWLPDFRNYYRNTTGEEEVYPKYLDKKKSYKSRREMQNKLGGTRGFVITETNEEPALYEVVDEHREHFPHLWSFMSNKAPNDLFSPQHNAISRRVDNISPIRGSKIIPYQLSPAFSS